MMEKVSIFNFTVFCAVMVRIRVQYVLHDRMKKVESRLWFYSSFKVLQVHGILSIV